MTGWGNASYRMGARASATALVLATLMPVHIDAQAMREVRAMPADCRALLPASGARGGVRPWQEFVWLEHCDRIKRLLRLSSLLPQDQQPQFFEGIIPAARLPAGFQTDIPVLRVVFPERTFFDTAAIALRPEAQQVSAIIAESLQQEPPDVALFVAGHADTRGERPLNERLSIDRANAIAVQILRSGINFSSIWRVGFGEDMPLVSGTTAYAWDRNRRVEFLFAAKPEAVATWLSDQQLDDLCQARTLAEVAQCKRGLKFDHRYEALELKLPERTPVDPSAPRSRRVKLSGKQAQRVAPAAGSPRGVDPAAAALVAVAPVPGRRFQLDPLSRRPQATRLDL